MAAISYAAHRKDAKLPKWLTVAVAVAVQAVAVQAVAVAVAVTVAVQAVAVDTCWRRPL